MKRTLLVVDDTLDVRDLLEIVLSEAGFTVRLADGGVQMDEVLQRGNIDLIVLDTMMPGEDGFSICRRISENNGPPIIMLSAKSEDIDKIRGLNLGAEDYVAKPFNNTELIARINAMFRRMDKQAKSARDVWYFSDGNLRLIRGESQAQPISPWP